MSEQGNVQSFARQSIEVGQKKLIATSIRRRAIGIRCSLIPSKLCFFRFVQWSLSRSIHQTKLFFRLVNEETKFAFG